jgi:hypothetical protein
MAININEVVEYYKNLLIIQYNQKENARAEIGLFIEQLLNNDIYSQVKNAFNLDTAVGKQLDIIGRIVGVDRFYEATGEAESDQGQVVEYIDTNTAYDVEVADYNSNLDNFEVSDYASLQVDNKLSDNDYRLILKLRIVQNNSDHSEKSIDNGLFLFFGDEIVQSPSDNMTMVYFVKNNSKRIALIAFSKGVLPRPMGVNLSGLIVRQNPFFGFARYNQSTFSSNVEGFKRYGVAKDGEFLNSSKIINL